MPWEPNAGRHTLTVVVKATYALPAEGEATLLDEQPFVSGAVHYEDDVEQSLRWPSDLWPLKPCGEVLVVGSAHLPGEATQSMAAVRVGAVGKTVALFGDRIWAKGGVSSPEPFRVMPLRWERSFGGPGHEPNPLGVGLRADPRTGRYALPNIEDPTALLASSSERPAPTGLGPIPVGWRARLRHGGTYDAAWLEGRYPSLADDVDYRLFLASPEDQRIEGFFGGAEEIELRHLHPEHPRLRARLPGDTPVAFLVKDGRLEDTGARLDTIVIDADEGTATCLWRGVIEARLEDVERLFVHAAKPGDDYDALHAEALEAAAAEPEAAEEPPWQAPAGPGAPGGDLAKDIAARWAHLDQAMTVRGDDTALSASVAAELERRREQERQRVFRPVFEDALGLPAPDSGSELSPEEQLELEMMAALGDMPSEEEDARRLEVRDAVGRGESCDGWDLVGVDLGGLDLRGGSFRGANLTGANLSGASVRDADFEGAILAEAELSHAVFQDSSFVEVLMSPVRAEAVRFISCRFDRADARDSLYRGARFDRCAFGGADLSASEMSETHFEHCTLDEADLSEAQLNDARFVGSSLVDAWLGGVVAEKALFDGCDCRLLRASDEAKLVGASFRRANLDGARFSTSNLRGADLALATGIRADFSGAMLAQARLMGCVLKQARFDQATMVQTSLMRADLFQARLEGANLKHADLRGASLFQAELLDADLTDARLDLAFLHGTRRG